MARSAEPKTPVLVRLPTELHERLTDISAEETKKRRKTVSVPMLIAEYVAKTVNEQAE